MKPIRYEKRSEIAGLQWKQKAYPIRFSFRSVSERFLSGIVETWSKYVLLIYIDETAQLMSAVDVENGISENFKGFQRYVFVY